MTISFPPADYQHRNGFNNVPIIDKLNNDEKKKVEDRLISKLLEPTEGVDTLIVETLAYLKSEKALPLLRNLLKNSSNELIKLKIAVSIFEINPSEDLIDLAISAFKKLDNQKDSNYVYKLTTAFFYLIRFNSSEVNNKIKQYIDHKEYLLAFNAKRALGMQ